MRPCLPAPGGPPGAGGGGKKTRLKTTFSWERADAVQQPCSCPAARQAREAAEKKARERVADAEISDAERLRVWTAIVQLLYALEESGRVLAARGRTPRRRRPEPGALAEGGRYEITRQP